MPPSRTEVQADDALGTLRGHVAIEGTAAAGLHHFHHRLAVAHAVAAHGLDRGAGARRLLQGRTHRLAAASHPTGAEPDPDFDRGPLHTVSVSAKGARASHAMAGVSRPEVCPSTVSTGARLQQPRQATSSTVNRRSASVSAPSGILRWRRNSSVIWRAPATWQAVPWQTRTTCLPTGERRNLP